MTRRQFGTILEVRFQIDLGAFPGRHSDTGGDTARDSHARPKVDVNGDGKPERLIAPSPPTRSMAPQPGRSPSNPWSSTPP